MTPYQYLQATLDTAVYPEAGRCTERELNYLVHGLTGEAGELSNKVKKLIRNENITLGKEEPIVLPEGVRGDLIHELGDVLWYVTRMADALGYSLDKVMELNVEKLKARKAANMLKEHPPENAPSASGQPAQSPV